MTNKRWIAACFACLAMVTFANVSTSVAQTKVGIIDIGLVFKSHPTFSKKLEALKLKADQFKSSSLQRQQNLMRSAEALKQFKPGSTEYRELESRLAQQSAGMEVADKNTMRELMKEEAQLHYFTYQEINRAVSEYCEPLQIKLVLRYNSQEMDPQNPATVMQKVNSSVVFHQPQNDLTQTIIARLTQMNSTAAANSTHLSR